MQEQKIIDHLFRHQYGKMVSILTRIFGLNHLEMIEDAVQDTFINAMVKWRTQIPENPEAWLTQAAKNRIVDLIRKINAENKRAEKFDNGPSAIAIDNLFLDEQIEDSQLRMIFTACHPSLHPKDQIAFALKTIAGFSVNEIASSLLLKKETIKKRLSRARKAIKDNDIRFKIPEQSELIQRLERVHEVLYLIFNEGFHSNHQKMLIRKDLCNEALRLTKLVLKKEELRNGAGYALFALMCFHSARIDSKLSSSLESIDLKNQDRSKWHFPLMQLGNAAMNKAVEYPDESIYHLEAAIAAEHLKARSFEATDWNKILHYYELLHGMQGDNMTALNIAMIFIQLGENENARATLDDINPLELEQRAYLYYGVEAEYFKNIGKNEKAIMALDEALSKVSNVSERDYLLKKREEINSFL